MIIQCPHCQTNYRLEEKPVSDRHNLQFRCNQCGENFSIVLPHCPDPICLRGPFLFSSMMSSIGGFGLLQHHHHHKIL